MLAAERQARLLDVVEARRIVSTEDLASVLAVSAETVRRDLVQLGRQNEVRRVRGGAAARGAHVSTEAAFEDRSDVAVDAKVAIGMTAAALVSAGQTIVLDVGTTVLQAARALPGTFTGTVATCSLLVAAELAGRSGIEVLVCGGRVRRGDLAVSGAQAVRFFADLHPDVAFLGCGGVDAEAGLTDFYLDEADIRRVIIANAARSYVLADASKLARVTPHRVCALDELTGLVTEQSPPAALRRAARSAGVDIHVARRSA